MRHHTPLTTRRNASFDYARMIAVIGIIWFHAHAPGAAIGYSGLAFFLMLLMFLAVPQITALRAKPRRAPAVLRYAAHRAQRLIVPWLAACLLYGGLKLAEVMNGASWSSEFDPIMWLTGPALHLWFLPFAFVMMLLLWPLARFTMTATPTMRMHLCLTAAALSLTALALWQSADLPAPLAQWAYAMPAVLLGVALALTGGHILRMVVLAAFVFTCALSANWTIGLLQLGIATGVLLLCHMTPLRPTWLSDFAARGSFTLYLVHPAVIAVLLRSGVISDGTTTFAVAATLGSFAIVILLETIRLPILKTHTRASFG